MNWNFALSLTFLGKIFRGVKVRDCTKNVNDSEKPSAIISHRLTDPMKIPTLIVNIFPCVPLKYTHMDELMEKNVNGLEQMAVIHTLVSR